MKQALFPIPDKLGIAVVAPGGYPPDETAFERGIAWLRQHGCIVHNYYQPSGKYLRFGASDAERAAQLHAAANNPEVQVIIALRGGYGLSRILPLLDIPMLAASGKLFVGHSDFTALHLALLAKSGAVSYAGPMVCGDFGREEPSDFTLSHFWHCLSQSNYTIQVAAPANPIVQVTGKLWGGNLAMLTHLVGTPYFPNVDKGILFVEDVNEHPYRVERMLLQLLHAGVLARQQAILLGDFSNYRLSDYDNGYDFSAMLTFLRSQVSTPILTGLPFGHVPHKVTLPVGCQICLTSDGTALMFEMTGHPVLQS